MLWFSEHLHLGDEGRAGAGANVSRRSVHAKPRIRGRFVALERYGNKGRAGAQGQHIVQRRFAKLMYSASSRDGATQARGQLRGSFAHAHYRFRKRVLLVPFRCNLIATQRCVLSVSSSPTTTAPSSCTYLCLLCKLYNPIVVNRLDHQLVNNAM